MLLQSKVFSNKFEMTIFCFSYKDSQLNGKVIQLLDSRWRHERRFKLKASNMVEGKLGTTIASAGLGKARKVVS